MRSILPIVLGWMILLSSIIQASAEDWSAYKNPRFGFQFGYPSSMFRPGRVAANDDGQEFHSTHGQAKILAFGRYNVLEQTPQSYLEWLKLDTSQIEEVTYERVTRDWVVVTGFVGLNIYYEKTIFSCAGEVMSSLVMIYSVDLKPKLDPLVGPITKSLSPGVGYGTPEDCQ